MIDKIEKITALKVECNDLDVGDVLQMGTFAKPYRGTILDIDDPDWEGCQPRRAIIDTGLEVFERTFAVTAIWYYEVVGGSKIAAANATPACVQKLQNGYLWIGGDA